MTDEAAYALLDVGDGRRLERFGERLVDRPAPVDLGPRSAPEWDAADLRFERGRGWAGADAALRPWTVRRAGLTVELRPASGGQVGLFPEQAPVIDWLAARVTERSEPRVLNLFAYTGAATLAAAAAGARVVHVDASRTAVAWARRNAALSGLAERPVRWIVDDAVAFVRRERRRGARYDGVVLDPPSYGRGGDGAVGRGGAWRIDSGLADLLADCAALLDPGGPFAVLSAHTPSFGPSRLAAVLASALGVVPVEIDAEHLDLIGPPGVVLPSGACARWSG